MNRFKLIFLDVGITQSLLGLDLASWFLNPDKEFINRGPIAEAFVGQELLVYSSPRSKKELFFWKRESSGSLAKVDYLMEESGSVFPIEVKSGHGSTLRSMHQFLRDHPNSSFGMRFWSGQEEHHDSIISKPLYDVVSLADEDQKEALCSIVAPG